MKSMARSYQQKRRGESRDRTRQKIVNAAVHLHQTKGLAATTMDDIAKRAKVGRVTVYRHFPDEAVLARACSGQYNQLHPFPDLEPWQAIEDATERLRLGLRETYTYHRETEAMMSRILAEARNHPVMTPYHDHWHRAAQVLLSAWPVKGRAKTLLRAGITLALSFDTWRTLVGEGNLTNKQAVELMARITCDCE